MEHVTTIALSLASPVLLGIFGFLWKLSHKVTSLEKALEACQRGVKSNREQLNKHFEKAFTIRKAVPREFQ